MATPGSSFTPTPLDHEDNLGVTITHERIPHSQYRQTQPWGGGMNIHHNSPDLNPRDFFIFPRRKLALKGKTFNDNPDFQRNMTSRLNSIPKEKLLQSFQDMHSRSQRCIVKGGDYFEGQ
ncbi:histone-lysine N-methyltransferase SETMAR [Trichonephila clavipes]|nr:histone-lysine N-methyltransferase SETMAR [Trichonephila clavipes]